MTVYLAYGPNGCGKSTFALSGSGRKWYAEFDPGSFARTGLDETNPQFELHYYPPPLENMLDMGTLNFESMGKSGKGSVKVIHHLSGWTQMFMNQFVNDYLNALKRDEFEDYVFDTGKMMHTMLVNALQQRIQDEGAGYEDRRSTTLDNEEPNARWAQVLQAAKSKNRNVIVVSHEQEIWKNNEPSGEFRADGWRRFPDFADCSIRFIKRNKRPIGIIQKGGRGGMEIEGLEVPEPTVEKLDALLAACVVLRRQGVSLSGMDVEAIVATAGMMG